MQWLIVVHVLVGVKQCCHPKHEQSQYIKWAIQNLKEVFIRPFQNLEHDSVIMLDKFFNQKTDLFTIANLKGNNISEAAF